MRALLFLLFVAPLATAAQAQDLRLIPSPAEPSEPVALADRCGQAVAVPEPFADAPEAAVRTAPLGGPAPAPMPNLCAPGAASEIALSPTPPAFLRARPSDRFRDLPGIRGLRDADPYTLRDRWLPYPDLHDRLVVPIPEFHAPTPEIEIPGDLLGLPPVAPLGERE